MRALASRCRRYGGAGREACGRCDGEDEDAGASSDGDGHAPPCARGKPFRSSHVQTPVPKLHTASTGAIVTRAAARVSAIAELAASDDASLRRGHSGCQRRSCGCG